MMGWAFHRPVLSKRWTAILLYYFYTVLPVAKATCPPDAVTRVMMCTQALGLVSSNTPANAFVQPGKIQVAIEACRDNKLSKAVDCVQDITDSCQGNSDPEHFIRSMVDASKMRSFVTYFCSHLEEYKLHAPCIENSHANLSRCTTTETQKMQTKIKATSNMDYLMISTCKYLQAAALCSSQVLTQACSKSAADMVIKVLQAFEPPKCRSYVTYTEQTQNEGDSSSSSSKSGASSQSRSRATFWVPALMLAGAAMVFRTWV